MENDTISAISTPTGRGGIGIIRISGEKTESILRELINRVPLPLKTRRTYKSEIISDSAVIEECVYVFYKNPASYTGEDMAEISVHSNPFLMEEILNITHSKGCRPALPGEFTYRAYRAGKIDLIQAESVNELINANSSAFAKIKFSSLEGGLSEIISELKQNLTNTAVILETNLEFHEDNFMEEVLQINDNLKKGLHTIDTLLINSRFNSIYDQGLKIAVAGKPNVGKSSLFNLLLSRERSIVSSVPGTTRDYIEEKFTFSGMPFVLTDLAGINENSSDIIEQQGIQRSLDIISEASAVIFMTDCSKAPEKSDSRIFDLIKEKNKIILFNKSDIQKSSHLENLRKKFKGDVHTVSVKNRENTEVIFDFFTKLAEDVKKDGQGFSVNQRQRALFEELKEILTELSRENEKFITDFPELASEKVRHAINLLGVLTGEVGTDDILDEIFSNFCIGK